MPKVSIDNREVVVPAGATILDAARKLGIEIPTLCFADGLPPRTSCMVCVVRVHGLHRLVPACAYPVREGLVVESQTQEVREARRTALELLLADHLGDCVGPCQSVCPAHMDIPRMIRQIGQGDLRGALITVKQRIALPAVLGRICPELCEHGCRRALKDGAVSICLLKRYVADADLASPQPYLPPCKPPTGKRVAIVGAGPAGLSAAYYLLQQGHACAIYDDHERPGGNLRYGVSEEVLPHDVLYAEIGLIVKLGAQLLMGQRLGRDFSLDDLQRGHDAVLLAFGEVKPLEAAKLGLEMAGRGVKADRATWMTARRGVFVAGSALTPSKHAVRAVGSGRCAAEAIGQFLAGRTIQVEDSPWSVHIGRLKPEELPPYLAGSDPSPRQQAAGAAGALTPEQARCEAARCLRCDCAGLQDCRLRLYAEQYDANPNRFRGPRLPLVKDESHPEVVHEPGKCISCGLCVQISAQEKDGLGLAYIGRGFNMRIAVPFNASLKEGLGKAARACADACPTGALVAKPGGQAANGPAPSAEANS